MDNFSTMQEIVTLPSKGRIYDREVDPNITLRSMTTQDEMVRLSPSDTLFTPLCQLIDNCIVNNPGISSYDLCLGDYIFLLHRLRAITYGEEYETGSTCAFCGSFQEQKINLNELEIIEYDEEEIQRYREFILPVSNKRIRLNFQTPRMLDAINQKVKEFKRKHKNIETDYNLMFTLIAIIDTIDDRKPDPIVLEEWIKKLNMKDTNMILQYASKLNTLIGVNTTTQVTCPVCGLDYDVKIRADMEFFRPALD